jgi:hypothetical protein
MWQRPLAEWLWAANSTHSLCLVVNVNHPLTNQMMQNNESGRMVKQLWPANTCQSVSCYGVATTAWLACGAAACPLLALQCST